MGTPQKKRVIAFGELLLRLTTKHHERFVQASEFDARYTGAEANVAVSLAHFGVEPFAVSKVPAHEIGQACINTLRRFGVNTDYVLRGGDRLGIVYFELGASQRPTKLIYDRSHSCFQEIRPGEFDWKNILRDKHWFHFSGTAPARVNHVVTVLKDACSLARKLGVKVSCDVNYRSKLWTVEQARRVMPGLMEDVDVVTLGVEDVRQLFGIECRKPPKAGSREGIAVAREAMVEMQKRFGFSYTAMTLREEASASVNRLEGLLYDGKKIYRSRPYEIQIVDRIGGGDAFTAGLIYGFLSEGDPQQTIEFATAAACLKHSIPGDFNLASLEEVKDLMDGKDFGRVRR